MKGATYAWLAALLQLVLAVALAIRRIAPPASLVLGLAAFVAFQPLGHEVNDDIISAFFAVLFILFSFGLHEPDGRRIVAGAVLGFAANAVALSIDVYPNTVVDFVTGGLVIAGGPILLGRVIRSRSDLNATLRAKADYLRQARSRQAEQAAADERNRIAGELHDVVAHAMSAMVVQAGGARRLAAKDPDRAREAFVAVEETGREALTEIRRLLGVLRREDEEIALAPQPSLRHLDGLVRRSQAAGLPVSLTVDGDARELPPGVDLTAFRLVQAALTGALEQGAAGHADVTVRYAPDGVEVEVLDDGAAAVDRELLGVRERVSLYGGRLHAGRQALRRPRGARAAAGGRRVVSALWRRAVRATPIERDRVFAVLLFIAAEIEVAIVGGDAPLPVLMLIAAGYSIPFAWRRIHPLGVVCVVVASVAGEAILLTDTTAYFIPFVGILLFSYGAGAYVDGWRAYLGLLVMAGGVLTVTAVSPDPTPGDYIFPTSFAVVTWLSGRALRTRTRLTEELHEAALREEEAHELAAARAASDERRRIAREMHDVVAHSVSVMVVQAGGARRILERDPARAVAASEQIERTGREALAEMRRLLGVLHTEDDEHAARAPQPTMAAVSGLVQRAREAGLPVELHETGRAPLAARRAGPRRLPRRAGGAHQRAQVLRPGRDGGARDLGR